MTKDAASYVARVVDFSSYEALRGKKPNHLLMHAWSFGVFARMLSLQALRQKRRPRW
jgi:hypothetical protein